jgi:hypothetical protein
MWLMETNALMYSQAGRCEFPEGAIKLFAGEPCTCHCMNRISPMNSFKSVALLRIVKERMEDYEISSIQQDSLGISASKLGSLFQPLILLQGNSIAG